MPVEKREGSAVLAGSLLRSGGPLYIRYSTPSSLYHAMEEDATAAADERQGEGTSVVDRFSGWYTPLILAAAVILAVVPQAEHALRHGQLGVVGCLCRLVYLWVGEGV